jgi:hypothetical protein
MQDANVSNDLRQLSLGQVKALEYDCYDINGYHFWMTKLEASRPLAVTTNSGAVENGEDASGLAADYYSVLQKIIECTFGGTKELKVVFFECDWFDPVNGTRVNNFGMVEVKHESCYSGNNLLFAHQVQHVYYLSYPPESMKHWWVVHKVNPEIDTRRYDAYAERYNDDDVVHVYQEENEGHQSLSDEDITPLDTYSNPPLNIQGPITRARARQLNLEVSSFLNSSSYDYENRLLPNDYIVIRDHREDQGILEEGLGGVEDQQGRTSGRPKPTNLGSVFGLQEQSALKWPSRSHTDSDLGDLYMDGKIRR